MAPTQPQTSSATTAKLVRFHQLGRADVLQLEDHPLPQPGPGEVRLRVKAIGINRAECVFRKGQYVDKPILPSGLGYEASGIVEAVGAGVDPGLVNQIRSTVPAFHMSQYGVYGEVAIVPADVLAPFPESLSFEEGTSIWMQYLTAWGALCYHGKLTAGDFVVIPAASSSVGLAAIEIARAEHATAIALTRTSAKREALLDHGAHHVIATDEEDLVARIAEITGGKGARLTFDPVGGPTLEKLSQASAPSGILLLYGILSRDPTPLPLYNLLFKNLTVRGFTVVDLLLDPVIRQQGEQYVYRHLASGTLKPIVARTFPLAQIADAQRFMESNEQIGKIVVTI